MKILFFGDSITSAENNSFNGFVEKLNLSNYYNYGVSGTTIGSYSLYPVGNNDLINLLYKHEAEIIECDLLFLEYSSNDVSSVVVGYATLADVTISLVKALDYITQLNPNITICFIGLGVNNSKIAQGQCEYLNNIYLKNSRLKKISTKAWIKTYYKFERIVKSLIPVYISLTENVLEDTLLDADFMHPNDAGYNLISKDIRKQLNKLDILL